MKFTLPLPSTTNSTYRTGKGNFYKSDKQKDWETEALWIIKKEWDGYTHTGDTGVSIIFYVKRDRDIDSSLKGLLDVLQKAGVVKNDSLIQYMTVQKEKVKKDPCVDISIFDME